MRRAVLLTIVSLIFSIAGPLLIVPCSTAQVTPDEYGELLKIADSYMVEHRYRDAITAMAKAYDARPDANVLKNMAIAYSMLGMQTEAIGAGKRAFADGAEFQIWARHGHGAFRNSCVGSFPLSRNGVRWSSSKKTKENFEARLEDIAQVEPFESMLSARLGGGIPELRMRLHDKNWRFQVMIYGPDFDYQLAEDNDSILYVGSDLNAAKTFTRVVTEILGGLPLPTAKTVAPPAKEIQINAGMTKEEVIQVLGESQKTIVFGNKTILKYRDLTIELVDNKVVEVKAN